MQRCTLPFILILIFVLTACTPVAPPVVAPAPTTVLTPETSQTQTGPRFTRREDGGIRLDLAPDASPTEPAPTMEMTIVVTDEQTGQPINAAIYLGDRLLGDETDSLVVLLDGELDERLTVRAADYREWSIQVRYRVLHHKVMVMPVRMQPIIESRSSL
ncbi:MAG: hypothetical protein KDE58_43050 [Caldilineaceae bacterium]|nr:hypothetical protein [Caldilineaceae bacterium]